MAISFGSNLIHGVSTRALVDSDQTFGAFKNHIPSLIELKDLVDNYVDNGPNYFTQDLWGKYKPYATLIYIEDGRGLIEVSDQDIIDEGLVLDTTYWEVLDADGAVIKVKKQSGGGTPGIFLYTGNGDYTTAAAYDTDAINDFYVAPADDDGNIFVQPVNWANLNTITGGGTGTLSDVSITPEAFSGPSSLDTDPATELTHVILGDVTGNATDGYVVELPTRKDVFDTFGGAGGIVKLYSSGDPVNDNIKIRDLGNGYADLVIEKSSSLELDGFFATSQINLPSIGSDSTFHAFSGGSTAYSFVANNTNGTLVVNIGSGSHDTDITLDSDNIDFPTLPGSGNIASFNGDVLTRTSEATIVDAAYADLVETAVGTANQVTVSGTAASTSGFEGDITIGLADNLILGNVDGGSVVVGGAAGSGGYEVGLTVHGDSLITGSLTVQGGIVNTTTNEVSFEDSVLGLNVARDDDGNIEVTSHSEVEATGTSGIEVFMGADAGNSNTDEFSRPYIVYRYGGNGAIPGVAGATYGKWVLTNTYSNTQADGSGTWSANEAQILTSLDASLVDLSVNNEPLHEPDVADNNIKNLVSAYQLTTFVNDTIGGQSVDRRFGRVATNTHTYTGDQGEITLQHGLNSDEVVTMAVVVTQGAGSSLPTAGNTIMCKSKKGGDADERVVKIAGTVNGDEVKFVFVG